MEIFYVIGDTPEAKGHRYYLFYINDEPFMICVDTPYLYALKVRNNNKLSLSNMLKNFRDKLISMESVPPDIANVIVAAISLYANNSSNIQKVV